MESLMNLVSLPGGSHRGATPDSSGVKIVHAKGNVSTTLLGVLAAMVALPLVIVAVRLLALPGALGAG